MGDAADDLTDRMEMAEMLCLMGECEMGCDFCRDGFGDARDDFKDLDE